MSLLEKATLITTPTAHSNGKLHSVKGGEVADFDVVRGSAATRVNAEGLIESVAANIPRIDYTTGEGVVLLEPQSTNLITHSSDFSQSSWAKTSASITINSIISPDGSLNASTITEGSALNNHRISVNGLIGSGTHTITVFAKANDRNWLLIRNAGNNAWFDVSNGVVGTVQSGIGSIENYGNGWYRCSVTMSSLSTPAIGVSDNNDSYSYQGNGIGSLYIWGAQAEALSYPTSYIPTSGAIATRLADVVTGAGDATTFNSTEGVLYAEMAALANDGTSRRISISDGSISNRVSIEFDETANTLKLFINSSVLVASNLNLTNYSKIAAKYKANNYALWVNGFEVATLTTSSNVPSGLDRLNFDGGGGANNLFGKVKALAVFNEALTDSGLECLASWTSFVEMAQAQQYNII